MEHFYEGAEEKTKCTLGMGSDGNNLNIDMIKPPSMYIDVRIWDTYRKTSTTPSSSVRVANVENNKGEDGIQKR